MSEDQTLNRQITVKFQDGFELPYDEGAEYDLPEDVREMWDILAEEFPEITLTPLFKSISPDQIERLVSQAEDLDPKYEPPNFLTFFFIVLPPESDAEVLAENLDNWEVVEYAFVQSPPMPGPHNCPPGSMIPYFANQFLLDPPIPPSATAPHIGGIDAEFAWTRPGGLGAGINFVDVEKGWKLDHVDLLDPAHNEVIAELWGQNYDEKDHGTSVLGIIVAQEHCSDCHGIAPEADGQVSSIWLSGTTPPTSWDRPDAIMAAVNELSFGDVILLELQVGIPNNPPGVLLPVEFEADSFSVIRLATALGITVVEAAANNSGIGGQDLATLVDSTGNHIFNIGGDEEKDSGAIVVAAADPVVNPAPKLPSSNCGDRVNCFAWGGFVKTLHVDFVDEDMDGILEEVDAYRDFDATSATSAIVAGAAILVQAIAENNPAIGRYGPLQLRDILSDPIINTNSADPTIEKIGVMPNLRNIISHYIDGEALSDVYTRDHVGDSGEPHTGSISASPDVIVRAEPNPNPSAFSGTATINSNTLGSTVTDGQDHFVYVRALNRGAPATGVMADVYYSPPTTLQSPALWTYIGTTPSGTNVPSDTTPLSITVLDPISWPIANLPPDDDGFTHYCFIATIWSDDDPNPMPEPANLADLLLLDINDFYQLIRNNNNITWRNFNVVEMTMGAGMMGMMFMVAGWPNAELPMRFEAGARLPKGAQMWLEGPKLFMEKIIGSRQNFEKGSDVDRVRVPINPHGVNQFLEVPFPSELRAKMRLSVEIPEELRKGVFEIYARQLYQGEEVGRVTWLLAPPGFQLTSPPNTI